MLRFEVLQAEHGDCFLLRWSGTGGARLAVIDGGPDTVYANLRPRLVALKGNSPTLTIDWAMVSHIDDDHINGLLALMRELRNARDQNIPVPPFKVSRFWFNAFEDLAGVHASGSAAAEAAVASLGLSLPDHLADARTQAVLASVGQGRGLRDILDSFNLGDNGGIGLLQASGAAIDVDGLAVTVVGPLPDQLKALQDDWAKAPKARTAEVASYSDQSVANLSSLVCHVKWGQGAGARSLLLTGDARGDYILDGLKKAGLAPDGTLKVDLLKVQHHGSDRDVVKAFFAAITADHYVISANGKYNNPDKDTLSWLIEARGSDAYTLHLSNRLDWMDAFFAALKQGRNFTIKYRGELTDKAQVDEIVLD